LTQIQNSDYPPSPKKREGSAPRPVTVISIAVIVWFLMVVGGYYVGKLYIDRSIEAVQQTNAVHVQTMQNQLDSMANEIDQIQLALSNADQTLASSGTTQQNLNQKIQDLDKQLQLLAESLAILKEAP
jgi:peptidoglycan hydrolase CwlO-like protein